MDTISGAGATNMDNGDKVLTRKEIRRQKLMEYLAAKANLTLPSKKPNMGKEKKVESDRSAVKMVKDKENKIPALNRDTKDKTAESTYSIKRPLGLKNTVNSSCSKPREKQNSKNISIIKEQKAQQIPVFTRTYTVLNPKSTLNTASQKPPFTKAQSTVAQPTKAGNNTTNIFKSAASTSVKTISGRMIHGPIIKTRTGLTPAVVQPRHSKSLIFTTANDSKTSTNKTQSSTTSYRPTSQASNRSLRKTLSAVPLRPAGEGTFAIMNRGRNKPQNKCPTVSSAKHLTQARNVKISEGPHVSATYTSKSTKLYTTARTTKTNGIESNFRSRAEINKNKPCQEKTANSITSTRDNFKVNKTVTACGRGSKSTDSKESQKKPAPSKTISAPVLPKHRKMPLVSQTAPQPARTLSFTNRSTDVKTPQGRAPPQTVQKTLTAAQDRIKKLQEWREAKGISYKRPSMLAKTRARRTVAAPQPFWSNMEREDETHSLISAVDRSLADCIKLLGEGCPTHQVKEVLSRLPVVSQKFAKYWICQARLMEREGNLDVLPMFEKAVGLVVEPVDELRAVVFEILKKRDENQDNDREAEDTSNATETSPATLNDPVMTPKPTRALICAEKGNSSVVKYKITATPGGPPSQRRESTVVNGQEVRFFTPVRRSVRIERALLQYPVSLQDHDLCVDSYNDLIAEDETVKESESESSVTHTPLYIYRENDALKEKVSVEYVCNDE